MAENWRIALVDSCGSWPGAETARRFTRAGDRIAETDPIDDGSGHGTRLAGVINAGRESIALMLAQVLDDVGRGSADVVAAGIDWCVGNGVDLIHLSLGLRADRESLRCAIRRAIDADCIVVAATPARGTVPYPAAYEGVIRGTGDARCAPDVVSRLDEWTFGGCVTAPSARNCRRTKPASLIQSQRTRSRKSPAAVT